MKLKVRLKNRLMLIKKNGSLLPLRKNGPKWLTTFRNLNRLISRKYRLKVRKTLINHTTTLRILSKDGKKRKLPCRNMLVNRGRIIKYIVRRLTTLLKQIISLVIMTLRRTRKRKWSPVKLLRNRKWNWTLHLSLTSPRNHISNGVKLAWQ